MRNNAHRQVKMALLTKERYADCPIWQVLVRSHSQELVALSRHPQNLLTTYPLLEILWLSYDTVQSWENNVTFAQEWITLHPGCALVLCLPDEKLDYLQQVYALGVHEIMFYSEFQGTGLSVPRMVASLAQRRWHRSIQDRARSDLEKLLRQKREALTWLSHEIRTPMNGILGMSELLLKARDFSPEHSEMIEVVSRSAQRVVELVSDILDQNKLESGKMPIVSVPFEVRRLVDDCISLYGCEASLRGLMVYNVIAPDVPVHIVGDEKKLAQILGNLLSNAVKYTEHGQVCLAVEVERLEPGRAWLRFEVQDTGHGISREESAKIFLPFEQTDSAALSSTRSSGLGLHLTKQLVERIGGHIDFSSERGVGTNFVLIIPFASSSQSRPILSSPSKRLRIVIVGQRQDRVHVLQRMLAFCGCTSDQQKPEDLSQADIAFFIDRTDFEAFQTLHKVNPQIHRFVVLRNPMTERLGDGFISGVSIDWLDLPLRQSQLEKCLAPAIRKITEKQSRLEHAESQLMTGGRILVVDDDLVNLKVAQRQLTRLNSQVQAVSSPREALEVLNQQEFDLVLLDYQMPEMNGGELLHRMRQSPNFSKGTPVIALTALALRDTRQQILAEGFDDYLAKPAGLDEMSKLVERWVPLARLTRKLLKTKWNDAS